MALLTGQKRQQTKAARTRSVHHHEGPRFSTYPHVARGESQPPKLLCTDGER